VKEKLFEMVAKADVILSKECWEGLARIKIHLVKRFFWIDFRTPCLVKQCNSQC
jgi:hypothetical protein